MTLPVPIQVKQSQEETHSLGISLSGSYGHFARGNIGTDHGTKNVNTTEFKRHAAVEAVTATGTINRGRGVYFKLRWTAQQVLEGEKVFQLTLRVPPSWHGSLIDVSVVAQAEHRKFGAWGQEIKTLGLANFVVATYLVGDREAETRAKELADAEETLRQLARQHRVKTPVNSLPSMLRHVARKLDLEPSEPSGDWIGRLLLDRADPYLDETITKLPMPIRIAAIDYTDVRDKFLLMNE